ncbi:MAG: hypothetical protein ACK5F1_01615 [Burkholderiales bacterium]|jgi:hypothetical protein
MPRIAKKITQDPNKSHLLPDFLWFRLILLNKHMKHDVTNAWLKRHGLRPDNFALIALEQARATVVATALLKQRVGLVDASQKRVLEHFALQKKTKAGRAQITEKQCYKVLNIGKQANRKLFKTHRELKRQQRHAPQR